MRRHHTMHPQRCTGLSGVTDLTEVLAGSPSPSQPRMGRSKLASLSAYLRRAEVSRSAERLMGGQQRVGLITPGRGRADPTTHNFRFLC